jgi:dephospho-CoA kinase
VSEINIILFGNMGSGKTTVANYLCDNYRFTKFSLGKKIHEESKLHGNETREEMQNYGQMMREIFGINVWCDYVFNQSKSIYKTILDDGRQVNEFFYFLEKGYLPVGIVADINIRLERLKKRVDYEIDSKTFNHDTEIQASQCIERCDIKIYNNGSYTDLVHEIENKLGKYLKGGM